MKKKMIKNKNIGNGLISLTTIIIILISVLAGNVYYEKNITANVVKELTDSEPSISIKEMDNINELNQLNEGWYEIRNGYVFYLEHFDYAVPLYIKVKNPEKQNGMLVVDEDGNVAIKKLNNEIVEFFSDSQISGNAAGMERVSGFVTTASPSTNKKYLTFNEIVVDGQIAGQTISKIDNKKDGSKVVTLDNDKKITVRPNQLVEVKSGNVINPMGTSGSGGSVPPTQGPKPVFSGVRSDGTEVFIYPQNKDGFQTIKIGDKTLEVHKNILGTITNSNWDGNIIEVGGVTQFTIKDTNRERAIEITNSGTQKSTEEIYANGKLSSKTITEKKGDGSGGLSGDTITTRTTGINTQTPKTTQTITYSDNSQLSLIYEGNSASGPVKSVTYTSQRGKQVNIALGSFLLIEEGENAPEISRLFLEEVSNRGITEINKNNAEKDDIFDFGNPNGVHVKLFNNKIASFEGDNLVGYIDISNPANHRYYSLLEGTAKLDDNNNFQLDNGGTAVRTEKSFNQDSKLIEKEIMMQKTTVGLIEGYYDDDTYKIVIGDVPTYTINTKPIEDDQYPNGKIEITGPDCNPNDPCFIVSGEFGAPFGISIPFLPEGVKIVNKGGEEVSNPELELALSNYYKTLEKSGQPTPEQLSSQRFFANVERIFTEFRGLEYYATLFFDEDSLLVWRDNVDRAFATLYLGTEYWSSGICGSYLDGEDEGIAYAETPQGLAQVGAHIEATRTEPIIDEKRKRAFIYKITFNVRNGDYGKDPRAPEQMKINVVLKGDKTAKVFKEDIKIERGDSFGKMGSDAIVQDSATLFTKVCLTFDDTPLRWKLDDEELCNIIQAPSSEPTKITQEQTTTAPSKGSQASKESEINDF